MKRILLTTIVALGVCGAFAPNAQAGATLKIGEESKIDFGFRLQALSIGSQADIKGDGKYETVLTHRIRRGRFRVKGVVNDRVSAFFQTEVGGFDGGAGIDVRLIDSFVTIKVDRQKKWLQFLFGQHMPASSRTNLTSSGALMTIDRPGIAYKSLTWGVRARSAFTNGPYPGGDSSIRGATDVRDLGISLFGSGQVGEKAHLKYYAGTFNGIQASGVETERVCVRGQLNLFEAESGYFNSGTYLGKKKTVGIGVSADFQSDIQDEPSGVVAGSEPNNVDYKYYSVDLFAELPTSNGGVTLEGAFSLVDLGDYYKYAAGNGFYLQGGYTIGKWQPWLEYEMWTADADDDAGTFNSVRVGGTYFIEGQHANLKLGLEYFKPKNGLNDEQDGITSVVGGVYVTY